MQHNNYFLTNGQQFLYDTDARKFLTVITKPSMDGELRFGDFKYGIKFKTLIIVAKVVTD